MHQVRKIESPVPEPGSISFEDRVRKEIVEDMCEYGNGRRLRDAQEHPENYTDLHVLVASHSALWIDLPREAQDGVIALTEHSMR